MADETKRIPDVSCAIDPKARTVLFTFPGLPEMRVDADALSADIFTMATLHGLKQKIGDAGAIQRDPATGRSATAADKRRAMQEVLDRLLEGRWNKGRADGNPTGGLLYLALCRMYDGRRTPEEIKTHLGTLTPKQQSALRESEKIAAIIATIKAERAADGEDDSIDADELLAGLE